MAVLILYLIMRVRFILCLLSDFSKIRFELQVNLIYVVELFQLANLENKSNFQIYIYTLSNLHTK